MECSRDCRIWNVAETVPLHRDSQGQLEQLKQVQMIRSQQAERSLQEYKVEMERSTSQLFQQMKDEVISLVGMATLVVAM